MKKKLLILLTLVVIFTMALAMASMCYAEEAAESTETGEPVIEEATADNDAWTWIKEKWEIIKPRVLSWFDGLSVGGIVAIIVGVIIRRGTNKGFDKIEKKTDAKSISDAVSENIEDHFSKTTIDVNIAPLMERQYLILSQKVYADLDRAVQKMDAKYLAMVECYEKLAHYYDGSIGVTDVQRQEFYDAVQRAKNLADEEPKTTAAIKVEVDKTKPAKKKEEIVEPY